MFYICDRFPWLVSLPMCDCCPWRKRQSQPVPALEEACASPMSPMWSLYRKHPFFSPKECLLSENLLGKEIFISEINDINFFWVRNRHFISKPSVIYSVFSSLTRRYVTLRIAVWKAKNLKKWRNSSIWLASNTLLLNWYRSMLVVITSCLVDFLELIQPRSVMHSFPGILNIPDSYVSFSN